MAVLSHRRSRLRSVAGTPLVGVLVGAPVSALLWVGILLLTGVLH